MSLNKPENFIPPTPTPERSNTKDIKSTDDGNGRKIVGLEPRPENFSILRPGKDLTITDYLAAVESDKPLEETFIFINPRQGKTTRLVEAPHWRSISTEQHSTYTDKTGLAHHFYDTNIKGCGYTKLSLLDGESLDDYDNLTRINEYGGKGIYGMARMAGTFTNHETGESIVETSKKLIEQGLRTELYWAVGKLKQIPYKGKLTPIKKLQELQVISSTDDENEPFVPAIGVRLLKTNTRIEEIYQRLNSSKNPSQIDKDRAVTLYKKAFKIFNLELKDSDSRDWESLYNDNELQNMKKSRQSVKPRELKWGDSQSEQTFYEIFFRRMGKNLAVLLNNGILSEDLHSSNVTMAAEIVDIGDRHRWTYFAEYPDNEEAMENLKKYSGVRRSNIKDIRDIAYDLRFLLKAGNALNMNVGNRDALTKSLLNAFAKNLNNEQLREQEYTHENVYEMAKRIFQKVLVEKENLPALKHGADIKDWMRIIKMDID
ncbi:MAG TPA: hypothetical protein PLB38_02165 [bacterium]|nr:hypothetical protein [bacterium]